MYWVLDSCNEPNICADITTVSKLTGISEETLKTQFEVRKMTEINKNGYRINFISILDSDKERQTAAEAKNYIHPLRTKVILKHSPVSDNYLPDGEDRTFIR